MNPCEVCGQHDGHLIFCYLTFEDAPEEDAYFEALFAAEPDERAA